MEYQQTEIKCALRRIVAESKNALSHPEESDAIEEALRQMLGLMDYEDNRKTLPSSLSAEPSQVKREFLATHYSHWLEYLVDKFDIGWLKQLGAKKVETLVDVFFLKGNLEEAFMVLSDAVSHSSGSYRLHKSVSLLETILEAHELQRLLWEQCQLGTAQPSRLDPDRIVHWQQITNHIVTLPDRVLAKLHTDASELFYPKKYVPLVTTDLVCVLEKVKESLAANKDCSLEFASQLLGRLCLAGHANTTWSVLLPALMPRIQDDYIWCRVCERLVTGVPDRCLESTVIPLLHHAPWYGTVSKLLGHSILNNSKLEYLLTQKLLLLRYFTTEQILKNILGYLAASSSTRHLLTKVWLTLLDVWSDSSAIRHTPYDQHVYVTKAILVSLAFLSDSDRSSVQNETLTKLMKGVQSHLDSPIMRVRRLGMVVAEQITTAIGQQGQKLQFEYDVDEEVELLKTLVVPPVEPDLQHICRKIEDTNLEASSTTASKQPVADLRKTKLPLETESDLDSDDDLEPYNLSCDTKASKVKAPVYLRDCIEGLLSSEDPDKLEASLKVAERLVRNNCDTVQEVAVEMCKILLHLQENPGIAGFLKLRFSTMVALSVVAPKQVAEYLTAEFYDRNYNLRQRMDILEVLGAAAQELSRPVNDQSPLNETDIDKPLNQLVNPGSESQNWREVVQQRIERNTRRFGKGRQSRPPQAVVNRFASVAGEFFFPLLRYFDKRENTLDLLGTDHLVLSRLVYTLGIITYAALNVPILRQIAKSLLEFIWVVQYHPQPAVRQALLFAVSMVILAVPSHMLVTEFQAEVIELKSWLEDIVEKDVDKECQKMALQALVLLENSLKKEFEPS